jgi:N-acetylmuramoyl-L-alanine amidase
MPRSWSLLVHAMALALPIAAGAAATEVADEPAELEAPALPTALDMTDPHTCLAAAMYWESKGEGEEGMLAVASVVLNRVEHEAHPDEVCAVVTDGDETPPCQFSFWCDGLPDEPIETEPWWLATDIAERVLTRRPADTTGGALFYHASHVDPWWTDAKEQTVQIGGHVYYR